MPEISTPDHASFEKWVVGFASPVGMTARSALAVAAAVAAAIFVFGSRTFSLPKLPGFDGSILAQPAPLAGLLVVAVMIFVAGLVGTVIAGGIHFDAGLFAAACGLIALSCRSGTMQSVLFDAAGSQDVFIRLIMELLILGAFLFALWFVLYRLSGAKAAAPEESGLANNLTATVSQAVATGVVMMFLCQSEAKNQALASVGISSLAGAMIAYKYAPTRPSFWFWIGPLLTGVIGYALAALGQDSNLNVGVPTGTFAALARPLPLDYAGAGVAGALLGYWMVSTKVAND